VAVPLLALAILLVTVLACGLTQSQIEGAVGATLTAERSILNAVDTSVAATVQAGRTPVRFPTSTSRIIDATQVVPEGEVCGEDMGDLRYLSGGFLEGGRYLATFEKLSGFEAESVDEAYTLRINGLPYACSILNDNRARIYCIGRPIPPGGNAQASLFAFDESCQHQIPFETILVPPPPTRTPAPSGPYG
jgi:hypothetical protein